MTRIVMVGNRKGGVTKTTTVVNLSYELANRGKKVLVIDFDGQANATEYFTNGDEEFYIGDDELKKWKYLKGPKKEMRKNADGFEYNYSEGGMIFPDPLDKPSRTIITGEGGKSASRFKHVIQTPTGLRRLLPV